MTEKSRLPEWPTKWAGKTWKTKDGSFSEEDLKLVYKTIPKGSDALRDALDGSYDTNRRLNRALQKLREARLIEYDKNKLTWRRVRIPAEVCS